MAAMLELGLFPCADEATGVEGEVPARCVRSGRDVATCAEERTEWRVTCVKDPISPRV